MAEKNLIEKRTFKVEVRAAEDGRKKIRGYAAKYDVETEVLDFIEVIRAGAFDEAIQEDDVRALWNHNDDIVLGRNKAGTLRLFSDDVGLGIEVDPPDTQWGRDAMVSIERGDVSQMSFAFAVKEGGERWSTRNGKPYRELINLRLYDISPVTYPAYQDTEVSVRAADHLKQTEAHVPLAGYSADVARNRLAIAERAL